MDNSTSKNPSNKDFVLPHAPRFSKFLKETIAGKLTISEPENLTPTTTKWLVFVDGEQIGEYTTRLARYSRREKMCTMYSGSVPGVVNELTNTDKIGLQYDNVEWLIDGADIGYRSGNSPIWSRKDGHDQVPFP